MKSKTDNQIIVNNNCSNELEDDSNQSEPEL